MSDKYGDWIVFKPQFNTQNSLLWILPYIVLIFGGFFIFFFLKKDNKTLKETVHIKHLVVFFSMKFKLLFSLIIVFLTFR
jgi:cytochrome c-type biogenesis protein CcmH/NrfF